MANQASTSRRSQGKPRDADVPTFCTWPAHPERENEQKPQGKHTGEQEIAERARYEQSSFAPSTIFGSGSVSGRTRYTRDAHSTAYTATNQSERGGREDMASVYSYNSSRDASQFVKEVHGRMFNSLNEAYLLPSDEKEWGRLDKQGSAMTVSFDGHLYPCADVVEAILDPSTPGEKRILDLGCGTGGWAIDMATKFPHAVVTGVDVAPTPLDMDTLPPNLSFEIDDVNLGLEHFHNQFDLVHMRCVMGGITDMDKTLRDIQLCLKPGGILIVIDGDQYLYEDKQRFFKIASVPGDREGGLADPKGSWLCRMIWEACEACVMAGSGMPRSREIIELGLWDSDLCDPVTASAGCVFFPVGPWARGKDLAETQMLQYVGVLMRQVFLNIHRAYHGILRKHGVPQATLDQWSKLVDIELNQSIRKLWVRFMYCCARRRSPDGGPAPPLPVPSPPVNNDPSQTREGRPSGEEIVYPEKEIYTSPEQARAKREQRLATMGFVPSSVARTSFAAMNQI